MKNQQPTIKKTYKETSVCPGLSGRCAPARTSASRGRNARHGLVELLAPTALFAASGVCGSVCRVLPRKERAWNSTKCFSSQLLAEFLESPAKLQKEGSCTFC